MLLRWLRILIVLGPFNPLVEEGWDSDVSPANTLWNAQGWDDLSDVTDRLYTTLYSVGNAALGEKLPYTKFVMKDTVNNKYYKIQFSKFTGNGNGGGFAYTRELIDTDNPRVGITFADGTTQTTASINSIPQHIANNYINYYLKLEDAGHHIYMKDNNAISIPSNQSVSFPIGTAIVIVSGDTDVSIYRDSGDTTLFGVGTNSSNVWYYIPARSIATLLKTDTDEWYLSGVGLTVL